MIEPYFGEFLVSPIPLELSLNWCSHACAFCFANLNTPDRTADIKKIMRFFADYQNRDTLAAVLLKAGYPVLMSNKVDPFAASNFQQTLPILETLSALGIPVAFQTRGGRGIDEALSIVGPSCWYVSVNTLDEDLRKRLEPGAPTIASRFELIERLRARGHRVVLGMNPLVPEWMPEPGKCLDRAIQAGAEGVWIEHLHFDSRQAGRLTAKERDVVTEAVIVRARRRKLDDGTREHIRRAEETAMLLGLPVYSIGQPFRSDFFQPYSETYPKLFPTLQGFINKMHDERHAGGLDRLISFQEFADWACAGLPSGTLPIDSYLGSTAHDLWHTHKIPPRMSYRELLAACWTQPKTHQCPARYPSFAYAGIDDERGGWIQIVDEDDMPYLLFDPAGFDTYWVPVEMEAA